MVPDGRANLSPLHPLWQRGLLATFGASVSDPALVAGQEDTWALASSPPCISPLWPWLGGGVTLIILWHSRGGTFIQSVVSFLWPGGVGGIGSLLCRHESKYWEGPWLIGS